MLDMEAIKNFSIDKSGWKKVKFGDVVFEPKESVKDPVTEGIEHVVGLEHIDSEDTHLRRSESIEESTTFTKKFRKGDVLFGRRRAYLKKAAKADFEGVCSGDITVMRAREDMLLPELLPFIVNNDNFFEYAVTHSAGGLSPRVKFKDLARYEILIPNKVKQLKLLELFHNIQNLTFSNRELEQSIATLKKSFQRLYFDVDEKDKVEINDISKVYSGGTPNRKKPEFWSGDIPWIKTAEVTYNTINETEEYITQEGLDKSATKLIPKNSVLVAMYGQGVTRGRVAITGIEATCNQACAVIEPSENFLAEFIFFYLEYKYEELRELAHGANQQNLNLGMIKSFKIPNFSKTKQLEVVTKFKSILEAKNSNQNKYEANYSLNKNIISKVF
jgi:type I restriction enzyme, S subunit